MLLAMILDNFNGRQSHKLAYLRPTPGVLDAIKLLDYLGSFKNQAAIDRRDQIQRIYNSILQRAGRFGSSEVLAANDQSIQESPLQNQSTPLYYFGNNPDESQLGQTAGFTGDIGMEGCTVGSMPIAFPDDPQAMFSLYHGGPYPLDLTGGDSADFELLERHIFCDDDEMRPT